MGFANQFGSSLGRGPHLVASFVVGLCWPVVRASAPPEKGERGWPAGMPTTIAAVKKFGPEIHGKETPWFGANRAVGESVSRSTSNVIPHSRKKSCLVHHSTGSDFKFSQRTPSSRHTCDLRLGLNSCLALLTNLVIKTPSGQGRPAQLREQQRRARLTGVSMAREAGSVVSGRTDGLT